eukprot:m.93686 g.93686  ORF g.93686 m.93686 type:complete len:309 (-) comp20316_c0_seq1:55-981(-)
MPTMGSAMESDDVVTAHGSLIALFLATAVMTVVLVALKSRVVGPKLVPPKNISSPTPQWLSSVAAGWDAFRLAFAGSWVTGMGVQLGDTLAASTRTTQSIWAELMNTQGDTGEHGLFEAGCVAPSPAEEGIEALSKRLFYQALEHRDVFSPLGEDDELTCTPLDEPDELDEGTSMTPPTSTGPDGAQTPSTTASNDDVKLAHLVLELDGYAQHSLPLSKQNGGVARPWLVEFEMAPHQSPPVTHISWVHQDGEGKRLGLRMGDVIVAINGVSCGSTTQSEAIAALTLSASVTHLTILRRDLEGGTRFV